MKIDNNMPDEFFDWLSDCPVQWFLGQWDKDSMNYTFNVPDEENTESEEQMKHKYIVWIGGIDEYFTNYTEAKKCCDYWKQKKYDDVVIEKIESEE